MPTSRCTISPTVSDPLDRLYLSQVAVQSACAHSDAGTLKRLIKTSCSQGVLELLNSAKALQLDPVETNTTSPCLVLTLPILSRQHSFSVGL